VLRLFYRRQSSCFFVAAVDTELWDGMPEEAMAHLKAEAAKTCVLFPLVSRSSLTSLHSPTGKFGQPHEIAQVSLILSLPVEHQLTSSLAHGRPSCTSSRTRTAPAARTSRRAARTWATGRAHEIDRFGTY